MQAGRVPTSGLDGGSRLVVRKAYMKSWPTPAVPAVPAAIVEARSNDGSEPLVVEIVPRPAVGRV